MSVPQDTTLAANGLAEAEISDTTLLLPQGMAANASAAGGLAVCAAVGPEGFGFEAQPGLSEEAQLENDHFTPAAVSCPPASEIGTVHGKTPLLEHELQGGVYLGAQDTNPFASPLVPYIIAEDQKSGVRVKLAGETRISETGQLTSVFKNTPPVPFGTLKLHLFDGPRASLATPPYCRAYESKAVFVPWSGGEPAVRSSSFTPTSGPNGTPCPSGPLPLSPSVAAGSTSSQAAAFSPFTLTIERPDGDQAMKEITIHLPGGVAAVLASVTPCPEPQATDDECGPASLIGHSTASAGLGPDPVTLGGKVYLTGPNKGAPFGLLAVTHAKAGPFNLGNVNVRSTINIDPTTAAVTVTSDPLPQYVEGVPSQIKELNVTVDRPNFEFNPTNCTADDHRHHSPATKAPSSTCPRRSTSPTARRCRSRRS